MEGVRKGATLVQGGDLWDERQIVYEGRCGTSVTQKVNAARHFQRGRQNREVKALAETSAPAFPLLRHSRDIRFRVCHNHDNRNTHTTHNSALWSSAALCC